MCEYMPFPFLRVAATLSFPMMGLNMTENFSLKALVGLSDVISYN